MAEVKPLILVTGGTGYIGSHTTVELIQAGFDVLIIDNLSNSNIEVLDGIEKITGVKPRFVKGDVSDRETIEKLFAENPDIQGVINFAASKAVGESVQKPLLYYRNNIVSLLNLLDTMTKYGTKGIVFSSSCTVYGEPDENPVTENSPIKKATSPYGNTKQICEEIICDTIASGAGYNSIILRYFNPVGSHPTAYIGELPNGVPNNLIPYLTQAAIGVRKQLTVFGKDYSTPDGTCIRDFINVVDLAAAHVEAVRRIVDGRMAEPVEVFNIGTGEGVSVQQLLDTFEEVTGVKVPYVYGDRREGDIVKVWGDVTRANEVLGWKAEKSLGDTMLSAWKWQLALRERGIM